MNLHVLSEHNFFLHHPFPPAIRHPEAKPELLRPSQKDFGAAEGSAPLLWMRSIFFR
jgi:hypothetical protein